MSMEHEDLRRRVDEHFTSGLAPEEEKQLRAHLPTCATCRQAYEAYQVAERLDPRAATPRDRLARALGLASRPWGKARGRWALASLAAAGAVGLLLVAVAHPGDNPRGMGARGTSVEPGEDLEVTVFRLRGGREAMRVQDSVSPGDELAFAYRNEIGKAFLMIFAVDGNGRVLWYHPAWTDPAENPRAVPITRQVGFKELPEAIRHSLQGTRLTLYSLFLDQPLDVRTVEARLASGQLVADSKAGEVLREHELEVQP